MRRIRTILLLATFLITFSISPARAVPVEGPDGSFYELVSTAVTWPAARAAALAASYQGVPGQLAITSAAVDSLLAGLAPIGWLVGMGHATEGTWTWADGPRAKPVVWIGLPGGSAPAVVYTYWGPGEADDGGVQDSLLRIPSGWDDSNGAQGYSIRYSAPEPATFLLVVSALAGASLAGWRQRRRAQAPGGMRH